MAYPIVGLILLSLVVRNWPGQLTSRWISTWLDRVWLLLGLIFGLGIALAFYNGVTTDLPNGGYRYVASTPKEILYMLAALLVPLTALSVIGAAQIIRPQPALLSRRWREIEWSGPSVRLQSRKIALCFIVALAAIGASWAFGGPLTYSSKDGHSSIVPLLINVTAAMTVVTAVLVAWDAAKSLLKSPQQS